MTGVTLGAEAIGRVPVGAKIRSLRLERGVSLKDFAAALGISSSALSQIERGVTQPSVNRLPRISSMLGVPLSRLFDESHDAPVEAPTCRVFRSDERPVLTMSTGVEYRQIIERDIPGIDLFESIWQPGASSGADGETMSHDGWEGGTLIEGTLVVEVDQARTVLSPGDSIDYPGTAAHRLSNPSSVSVARAVWVISH